jgi:hypothetical protein
MNIDKFIKIHHRTSDDESPILFFHRKVDGVVEWQGYIYFLRKDGTGMARLLSWATGENAEKLYFTKDFLKECVFFNNDYDMRMAIDGKSR